MDDGIRENGLKWSLLTPQSLTIFNDIAVGFLVENSLRRQCQTRMWKSQIESQFVIVDHGLEVFRFL
jgi:hypothetical protein